MATRNYKYGCRNPNNAVTRRIITELERMNAYRNQLVTIELERRESLKLAAREASPQWAEAFDKAESLDAEVEKLLAKRRAANQAVRGIANDDAVLVLLAEARKQLIAARAAEKVLRAEAYKLAGDKTAAINDLSYEKIRAARAASNLYWGNYLLVENSAEEFRRGAPPKYRRFTGEGSIGVQLQGGASEDEVVESSNTRLRVVRRDPPKIVSKKGVELKVSTHPERYREVWMRIGSLATQRDPEWVRVPMIWHRDLPTGARIKWATISRKFVGGKERWSLLLTIDVPEASVRPENLATTGACGIDIGYRVMSNGSQRIAIASGDDNDVHELRIDAGMVKEWLKCRDIRSIRDTNFNLAREKLVVWLKDQTNLPHWLADVAPHLHSWRSTQRFSQLVYDWNVYRPQVPNEESILPILVDWRKREEHLYQYESQLRDQLLARRKHLYRNWMAMLRSKYATCYIEQMDLRDAIHDTLRNEEEQEVMSNQRASAAFASLSELRNVIKGCGMVVHEVKAAHTTTMCHVCHNITDIDAEHHLQHTCEHCGAHWDQDVNAARNILASKDELVGPKARKKKVSKSERHAAARQKRMKADGVA